MPSGNQEMQELATKVNTRSEVIKTAEARVKQANLDMKKAYEEREAQIHSLFREVGFPLFNGPTPPNKSQTLYMYLRDVVEDSTELPGESCKGTSRCYSVQ